MGPPGQPLNPVPHKHFAESSKRYLSPICFSSDLPKPTKWVNHQSKKRIIMFVPAFELSTMILMYMLNKNQET